MVIENVRNQTANQKKALKKSELFQDAKRAV
jgi:hypothetical protein